MYRLWRLFYPLVLLSGQCMGSAAANPQKNLGDGIPTSSSVAVVVKVASPWYAPDFMITRKMRDTAPTYQSIPGLNFKAFVLSKSGRHFGGIYLWQDIHSVRSWFTPEWFSRVTEERGSLPEVLVLEVRIALDNTPGGTLANHNASAIATLVESAMPSTVNIDAMDRNNKEYVRIDQKITGLLRKYFITTEQGKLGGIYLWEDEASAKAFFTQEWHISRQTEYRADKLP